MKIAILGLGTVGFGVYDIIQKSGAWYAYQGDKIGQGRENAKAFLEKNQDILKEIEDQIRARLKANNEPVEEATEDDKF